MIELLDEVYSSVHLFHSISANSDYWLIDWMCLWNVSGTDGESVGDGKDESGDWKKENLFTARPAAWEGELKA